jgi:hypothetical protein
MEGQSARNMVVEVAECDTDAAAPHLPDWLKILVTLDLVRPKTFAQRQPSSGATNFRMLSMAWVL